MKTESIYFTNFHELINFIDKERFKNSKTQLVQIFSGILNKKLLQRISKTIIKLLPNASILGSTTDGEILENTISENKIVISFSTFKNASLKIAYVGKECNDDFEKGAKIANKLYENNSKVFIIFADGLSINGSKFLEGIKSEVKDIIVAGGLSADNSNFKKTYLIANDSVYAGKGAVGVSINSDTINVENGYMLPWRPIGREFAITKSKDNIIYEIDEIDAKKFYQRYLGNEIANKLPSIGIEFPLMYKTVGELEARAVVNIKNNGSLVMAGEVPKNVKVRLGIGSIKLFNVGIKRLIRTLECKNIDSIFIYSCTAVKRLRSDLKNANQSEFDININKSGFYTYGEFYTNLFDKSFHLFNETFTFLSFSEQDSYCDRKKCSVYINESSINNQTALTNILKTTLDEHEYLQRINSQFLMIMDSYVLLSKTDIDGKINYISKAYEELTGYCKDELIGKTHSVFRSKDTEESIYSHMWEVILNGETWEYNGLKNIKKDGTAFYINVIISPIKDSSGKIVEFISLKKDVTQEKFYEVNSITDSLTSLYNRRYFDHTFPIEITKSKRLDTNMMFVMIDIDCFKNYNDFYGHQEGDKALKIVSKTLKKSFKRKTDLLFRVGGEEFGAIILLQEIKKAKEFLQEVVANIKDLNISHKANQKDKVLTISLGAVIVKSKSINAQKIYKIADDALYLAKKKGKNRVELVYL